MIHRHYNIFKYKLRFVLLDCVACVGAILKMLALFAISHTHLEDLFSRHFRVNG